MLSGSNGTAVVTGRFTEPEIVIQTGFHAVHPGSRKPLRELFKEMRGRWDKERAAWVLTGTPRHPDKFLTAAGLSVSIDQEALPGVTSLEELYWPMSKLADNGRQVMIRHRLCGFVATEHMLGMSATWDRAEKMFMIPVTDVYDGASPRAQILWDQDSIDASFRALTSPVVDPSYEQLAADMGRAIELGEDAKDWLAEQVQPFPAWWAREPFAFQVPGAYAVKLGHTLLADAPGLGKTTQIIAAAALHEAQRILISCPPLLAVNWAREFRLAGYEGEIAVFRAGRKAPKIPDTGVVIVPDSLLASRAALRAQVIAWGPDYFAVDEAHRMGGWNTKRTKALLDIAHTVPPGRRVAASGTPLVASPAELVSLLDFTGHLGPVFGGADRFLKRFCTRDPFGKFKAKRGNLGELHQLMQQRVWVRREKSRVLPFLPKRFLTDVQLEVDLAPYREAHDAVIEKAREWVDEFHGMYEVYPGPEEIEEFARADTLGFFSQLWKASALTKIPAATEMIAEHIANDPDIDSPLVAWIHHRDTAFALAESLENAGIEFRMLIGGISDKQRQEAVDEYQAGHVRVLIASITAAGVGITLTRGCEALFVESSWVPALVTQAVDRQSRIGQTRPVIARTMIALNTLDEHLQKVQRQKQDVVGAVTGDDQADVALLDPENLTPPWEILRDILTDVVHERIKQAA
ncbi:DEAD/DEAH box helicase [Leucobacter sp. HY1910]